MDLPQFVVPMSPTDLNSTCFQDWEFVAKFFLWMEHQVCILSLILEKLLIFCTCLDPPESRTESLSASPPCH